MLDALRRARRPVALTGAGISAPSGVPTFDVPWKGRPVRDMLGRDTYRSDPYGFFELYCAMQAWTDATPNAAHRALAAHGVSIITQNIDGLHQRAGSTGVIELHGNLRHVKCPACGWVGSAATLCRKLRPMYAASDRGAVMRHLTCRCGVLLDMDVVLYDDPVRGLETAVDRLMEADLLLVIGTSLTVYPAAALPDIARERGTPLIIENTDCIAALTEQGRPAAKGAP